MSYNVIKSVQVKNYGRVAIDTKYEYMKENEESPNDNSSIVESYENIGANIIKCAKEKAEEIHKNALQDIIIKEKEVYERAYEDGKRAGYDQGYKEGYESGMEECRREEKVILGNANRVLDQCQEHYDKYLREKEIEIKETIVSICEEVLKREVDKEDGINDIIFSVLSEIKKAEKIIIRCNEKYYASISSSLEIWKNELTYRAEIFLIKDNRIQNGEAVIEKDSGITKIDINYSLDKIREIILYEE